MQKYHIEESPEKVNAQSPTGLNKSQDLSSQSTKAPLDNTPYEIRSSFEDRKGIPSAVPTSEGVQYRSHPATPTALYTQNKPLQQTVEGDNFNQHAQLSNGNQTQPVISNISDNLNNE